MASEIQILANRRNAQKNQRAPHKPPILSKLPTIYNLFMQNKANFRKSQMNVSIFSQMAYENKINWTLGENKPNSKPNKANFKCKAPLHKQCDLLHLKGSFAMGHLSCYWQTKPKVSDKLYRKAIK